MDVEKENTMRALAEKPLFAKRQWWCAFNIHTWLEWSKPVDNKRGAYRMVEQYRVCGCCGKAQRRVLNKEIA